MNIPRLHVITDDGVLASRDFTCIARALVEAAGPRMALHVRAHATSAATLFGVVTDLAASNVAGSMILVNDRVDVALAAGAHGVQLGTRSLPVADVRALLAASGGTARAIGYSAHDAGEAASAVHDGADYIIAGTIWASETHTAAVAAGVGLLTATAGLVTVPVLAIGGVTPARIAGALEAGASGVAVLGAVWRSAEPVAALLECLAAIEACERNGTAP